MTAKTSDRDSVQTEHLSDAQGQTVAGTAPAPAMAAAAPPLQPVDGNNASATQIITVSGTANRDFLEPLLQQLAKTSAQGREMDEADFGFMCSVVTELKPRDQIEIMLAAQMAAVHIATMTSAQRLRSADNPLQQDSAERAFNKLARTFATQMEALTRYRTGAEHKVVQRVSVTLARQSSAA